MDRTLYIACCNLITFQCDFAIYVNLKNKELNKNYSFYDVVYKAFEFLKYGFKFKGMTDHDYSMSISISKDTIAGATINYNCVQCHGNEFEAVFEQIPYEILQEGFSIMKICH